MNKCFKPEFTNLEWEYDEDKFNAWCEGKTGFLIVDAAMRQVKQDKWMHNRTRMVVASFLSKDLLIDWRRGERYFMENLIDGDFASNHGGDSDRVKGWIPSHISESSIRSARANDSIRMGSIYENGFQSCVNSKGRPYMSPTREEQGPLQRRMGIHGRWWITPRAELTHCNGINGRLRMARDSG
jgi:hypothetical protein